MIDAAISDAGLRRLVQELSAIGGFDGSNKGHVEARNKTAKRLQNFVAERMREARERGSSQSALFNALPSAEYVALERIERAICIEGDYVADGPNDRRHPVERRIDAMRAVILRLQDEWR